MNEQTNEVIRVNNNNNKKHTRALQKERMGLIHTAAILSRETIIALSYMCSLAPKFYTARPRVEKQSFFSFSGQYGCRVKKA